MECERCGLCCYDAPCGCGYGEEIDGNCNNFGIKNDKAVCKEIENGRLHPDNIGIGKGCSYYIKGGRFRLEYSEFAEERLIEIKKYFEEDKENFIIK